ncbi:hypothetical protein G7Y89_g8422 [Cudoniella acicularis]|uniref:Uncharacterized protein n=1 Tax=Cudoniella acicularis TaxID=354080 RepID=A0A8H4W134_9HELO|nr:hypothetical protein G7Y89_g8422 [Cudoniella acicularis]
MMDYVLQVVAAAPKLNYLTISRHWAILFRMEQFQGLKVEAPLYKGSEGTCPPYFDKVASGILGFVSSLPQSIEDMYIELDNSEVKCDEDEDFDPIEQLGPEIFKSLTRLHTLDINAWITNIDGGFGDIPEKAIFCRRRPKDFASLRNTTMEMEGDFASKDADEPWLGGGRSWVSQSSKLWVNEDSEEGYDDGDD